MYVSVAIRTQETLANNVRLSYLISLEIELEFKFTSVELISAMMFSVFLGKFENIIAI